MGALENLMKIAVNKMSKLQKEVTKVRVMMTYRFREFVPSFLESENGRIGESRTDLKDSIEIMKNSADISDCRPLLDH